MLNGECVVFLSCTSSNADSLARPIRNALNEMGFHAVIVMDEPLPRGTFEPESKVDAYLDVSDAFVALCTEDPRVPGRTAENVIDEIGRARTRSGLREVVSVLKVPLVALPSNINPTWGDLSATDPDSALSVILRQLEAWGLSATAGATSPRADQPTGGGLACAWRHTTEGMEAPGAMHSLQKRLSHPGYRTREPGRQPPSVSFGLLVACDPIGRKPSASQLRGLFLEFLDQPPLRRLVGQLTAIANDVSWSTYDGNGRLMLGAILGDSNDEKNPPIASALLNLSDKEVRSSYRDQRYAELVLVVEPRDAAGASASPVSLRRWHERLTTALEVPAAFARFLSDQVGVETHTDLPILLGVGLKAHPDLSVLVDITPFKQVPGTVATSDFPSYFIAEQGCRRAAQVAVDMLSAWCDHALHLDGYEQELDPLC